MNQTLVRPRTTKMCLLETRITTISINVKNNRIGLLATCIA